jgi:hypothetical protein
MPGWVEEEADFAAYVLTEPGPGFEDARTVGRSLPFERVVDDVVDGVL